MSTPLRPLVIACSATKRPGVLPAFEKYDGPLWRTFRAHGEGYPGGVFVLSALHGLLPAAARLDDYDARLVPSSTRRVTRREVRASVLAPLLEIQVRKFGVDEVDFVGGATYVEALTLAGVHVHRLSARGIGYQRQALAAHLRAAARGGKPSLVKLLETARGSSG